MKSPPKHTHRPLFSLENAKYLKIKKNKDEIYIRNTAVCKNDYKVTKNRGRVVFMGLIFGDKCWRALFGLAPSAPSLRMCFTLSSRPFTADYWPFFGTIIDHKRHFFPHFQTSEDAAEGVSCYTPFYSELNEKIFILLLDSYTVRHARQLIVVISLHWLLL